MDPNPDPGVTTPPVEPAVSTAPAPSQPNGSEPVINSGGTEEQSVPFNRFQEVNNKAKEAEDRATRLENELEAERQKAQTTPQNTDDDVDPDVVELVSKSAKKLGFVSKEELDAREARIQVSQDINDLTSQYKDSGIPFDGKKVVDYAKANGMPIGSKKSLDAVYKEMNYDTIIEANRKAAIDSYQKGAASGGEKPGSDGNKTPSTESKPANLKDRIKSAREKANFSVI